MFIRKNAIVFGIAFLLYAAISGSIAEAQTTTTISPTQRISLTAAWQSLAAGTTTNGLAEDAAGNIFAIDSHSLNVLELPAGGTSFVTAVTNSILGGGLYQITAIAVDHNNAIYEAIIPYPGQPLPGGIIRVSPDRSSYTRLASGNYFASGLTVAPSGDVYFTDLNSSALYKIPASGGPTVQVPLAVSFPLSVTASASGDVYVGAAFKSIIKISAKDGTQSAISDPLILPSGIAVNAVGDLFVSSYSDPGFYKLPANGETAVNLSTAATYSIVTGNDGNLIVSDSNGISRAWMGSSPLAAANVCPSGQSLTSCSQTQRFTFAAEENVTLSAVNVLTESISGGDFAVSSSTCAANAILNAGQHCDMNITFSPQLPGLRRGGVQFVAADGSIAGVGLFAGNATAPMAGFGAYVSTFASSGLSSPVGVAADGGSNSLMGLLVVDSGSGRVLKLRGNTQTVVASGLSNPGGAAFDGAGDVWLTDTGNQRVLMITPDGMQTEMGANWNAPAALAVDGNGNAFVIDGSAVVKVSQTGGQTTVASNLGSTSAIALDGAGNLYVTDQQDATVTKIGVAGQKTTIGSGWSSPDGIAVDAAGSVIVSDAGNDSVIEITPVGNTMELATNLHAPAGLAVSPVGDIYVAVRDDNNVVVLRRSAAPELQFDQTPPYMQSADTESEILQNLGNASLSFINGTSVSSGFLQVDSASTAPECAATLAPGAECAMQFIFQPSTAGTNLGTVVISDNSLNSSISAPAKQVISLYGVSALYTQTVTLSAIPYTAPGTLNYVTASATSGLQVTITSLTPAVCIMDGTQLYAETAGTCIVKATQAGNSEYAAASTTAALVINLNPQSISLQQTPTLQVKQQWSISANATSGLYTTATSLTPAVCTVQAQSPSYNTVTAVAAGTCTVQVSQTGNSQYAAAAPVSESFTVLALSQTVQIQAFQLSMGSATVTASASSGLPVSLTSVTPSVCSLTQDQVTVLAAGTCTVQAAQAGNGVYAAASTTYSTQATVKR